MSARHYLLLAVLLAPTSAARADILYATDFNSLANDINVSNSVPGSTIYLAPATYTGGALPNILATVTLEQDPSYNAPEGSAILDTTPTGDKGLLTIPSGTDGISLTVEGLTFENANISSSEGGNGAGIRDQTSGPASLLVSDSTFLDNQDGILTSDGSPPAQAQLAVTISNSLFANNGAADGFEHALYIFGQSLNISGSVFCGTIGGHDVKSRAASTTITNSTLFDGAGDPGNALCGVGSTSYAVDAPNGGQLFLTNDQLIQDAATENTAIVSYGEEGLDFANNVLNASDDVFTSSVPGRGIQELANGVPTCLVPVQLSNTTFSSDLTPVSPPGCVAVIQPVNEPSNFWLFATSLAFLGVFVALRWRFNSVAILRSAMMAMTKCVATSH